VDATVAIIEDGKTLTLMIVNPQREPIEQEIDLSAFAHVAPQAEIWTVADTADARDPDVMNTFDRPERLTIAPGRLEHAASKFRHRIPALSVRIMRLKVGRSP
jgi:alpha-L-arabinofuranosidase